MWVSCLVLRDGSPSGTFFERSSPVDVMFIIGGDVFNWHNGSSLLHQPTFQMTAPGSFFHHVKYRI